MEGSVSHPIRDIILRGPSFGMGNPLDLYPHPGRHGTILRAQYHPGALALKKYMYEQLFYLRQQSSHITDL